MNWRTHMANWWTLATSVKRMGTAYETPSHIVICAEPGEALPADHDCVRCGCGMLHVLVRIPKPADGEREA